MTSPIDIDTDQQKTFNERASAAWEDVLKDMVTSMMQLYGADIAPADVEEYMIEELDIEDPYNDEFDIQTADDLIAYLLELDGVNVDDLYYHLYGESPQVYDEEDDDGGPVVIGGDADVVMLDPYYSSEDDEEPEDGQEFEFVLAVARAAQAELVKYLRGLPNRELFERQIAEMIVKIVAHKDAKKGTFPGSFFPVALKQPIDWPGFCRAMSSAKRSTIQQVPQKRQPPKPQERPKPPPMMRSRGMKPVSRPWTWLAPPPQATPMKPTKLRAAKAGKPRSQKPTVYEFDFAIWPAATCCRVPFRGRQLQTPSGGPGRSWPAIALDLDELAMALAAAFAPGAADAILRSAGHRILAAAVLLILAGRGAEVRTALAAAGFKDFADAESVILEFLALAYGVEGIRLAYAQLDTVLHLANIAAGTKFRGKAARTYTFLNVYSSVREFPKGPEHVYVEGIYERDARGRKKKELTNYEGFSRAPLVKSLNKKFENGGKDDGTSGDKSAKSVGKSIYSHSAGHLKVLRLLDDDPVIKKALWDQVRTPEDDESRRDLHGERFGTMGPIRLYNLLANVLRAHRGKRGDRTAQQVAAELVEAFACLFAGQRPPAGSMFRDFLPTASGATFDALLTTIMEEEGLRPADDEAVAAVTTGLVKNNVQGLIDMNKADPARFRAAFTRLVHTGYKDGGQPVLHLAVRTGQAWLVQLALNAGADDAAENAKGETAQAYAGSSEIAASKEITGLLATAHKRDRASQAGDLPSAWQGFRAKQKLGAQWLTDADVQRLLRAANLPGTELMAAVDIFSHPDALATFIRENYLSQMAHGAVQPFTIVPINFNNQHWAALVIQQNPARRSQPTVYFFDSLGSDQAKLTLVLTMLQATGVYTSVSQLIDLSARLQTDGYTCGSWLVFAASTIVTLVMNGQPAAIASTLAGFSANVKNVHQNNINGRSA